MNIYICDNCDTLATVTQEGSEITINKCKCSLTYCEECLENLDDDKFDYRFERPVCQECVYILKLTPDTQEGEY